QAIGIDLGTTNCCAAYMKSDTKVEVFENRWSNKTTPSVAYIGSNFKKVGEDALARRAADPRNTIFQIKRLIGRSANDVELKKRSYPFEMLSSRKGDVTIRVTPSDEDANGESKIFSPEQISSFILRYIAVIASDRGIKVEDVVITVPANFTDSQRQATIAAGEMAGLNVLQIINEPTAAALAYAFELNTEKERTVLVYDLGGGTFDVSIVRISGLHAKVLSSSGRAYLGGEDFDRCIFGHASNEFRSQGLVIDSNDYVLTRSCEDAKKTLSVCHRATIEYSTNDRSYSCEITRAKFEELCCDLFEQTIMRVTDAIEGASLDKEAIDDIVLVGGSSRIPKIKEMVGAYFGDKQLKFNIPPDHAVACGAAILAQSLSKTKESEHSSLRGAVKIADVLSHSIGTALVYDRFSVMLKKGTQYTTSQTKTFFNASDNLTELIIKILEGESSVASENKFLGACKIKVPKQKMGENRILTTFCIDENGLLSVHLCDQDTKKEEWTKVQTSKYSDEERMAMVRDARAEEEKEKMERQRAEARASFANTIHSAKVAMANTDSKNIKSALKKLIDNEEKWFKTKKHSNNDFIFHASSMKEKLDKIME
ncbi:hypothetical protein PMAYCL1PPCAC_01852, partial [Pristionchus mayeri]